MWVYNKRENAAELLQNVTQKAEGEMNDIFSIKEYSFPEGFEWGSATAGHQIEGDNIHSGHWASEQEALKKNPLCEVSARRAIPTKCMKRISDSSKSSDIRYTV